MQDVLRQIERNAGEVTSRIIKDLIEEHAPQRRKMIAAYQAYKTEKLEIHNRPVLDIDAADNRLVNAYRTEIVDQIVGYMYGNPITYNAPDNYTKFLDELRIANKIEDLDSKTGKMASICGYAARLCYIDRNNRRRVMDVPPWEAIVIKDRSLDETQYALRYYPVVIIEDGKRVERTRVEWYDRETVTFYIEDRQGNYLPDQTEEINPRPHLFQHVPLVKFANNDEEAGDFEKVESLINAYDRLVSDAQNILEDFRSAYMVFEGEEGPDAETVKEMKKTRAISGPGRVYYLIKEINDAFLENQKKTLNDNIYKFSQTVDMEQDAFKVSDSGEARKWRLFALENKAINKERKFSAALRDMFQVLCSFVGDTTLDYTEIFWDFTRNIPVDLQYLAEAISKLKGKISDETLLTLLPFVDDAKWELQKMKEEYDAMLPVLDTQDDGDLNE